MGLRASVVTAVDTAMYDPDRVNPMKTAAAVLCGGLSSRMGRDKALLPWRGRTLIEETVATLRRVTDDVIVVGSEALRLPALEARVIRDRAPQLGPLGGIREALEATGSDLIYVTGTDVPFLSVDFVRHVLSYTTAAAPVVDGYVHTMAAAYPKALAKRANALISEGRMRPLHLLEQADFRRILPDELPELESLRGVNTPEAYLDAVAQTHDDARIAVEFLGIAKWKAGRGRWETSPGSLREVLLRIQDRFPELDLVRDGALCRHYLFSLNETQFLKNVQVPLGPRDRLLILGAYAGG